jgi:hypothetical protein
MRQSGSSAERLRIGIVGGDPSDDDRRARLYR